MQVRSDSISFVTSAIHNAGVVVAVAVAARDRELLRSGGSVVTNDGHRRRQLHGGAAGAEGRLGRPPRQVRGHQRVRLRLRPQRALVAACAAPRGHAARAVPGRARAAPRPTATMAASSPEAEEGALRLLAMVVTSHAMLPTDVEASGLNHPANVLPPILGFLHSSAVLLCIQRVNTLPYLSMLIDGKLRTLCIHAAT